MGPVLRDPHPHAHPHAQEQQITERLCRSLTTHPGDINYGLFVTLFYGVLHPASGSLTYCNAGQTPPYLLMNGEATPLPKTGMALGIAEAETWEKAEAQIPPQARLLLYTDGVVDADNRQGEFFGSERLLQFAPATTSGGYDPERAAGGNLYILGWPTPDDITLMVPRRVIFSCRLRFAEGPLRRRCRASAANPLSCKRFNVAAGEALPFADAHQATWYTSSAFGQQDLLFEATLRLRSGSDRIKLDPCDMNFAPQ
jgi:hypothetical protein